LELVAFIEEVISYFDEEAVLEMMNLILPVERLIDWLDP
jgi:hypothetical protein